MAAKQPEVKVTIVAEPSREWEQRFVQHMQAIALRAAGDRRKSG